MIHWKSIRIYNQTIRVLGPSPKSAYTTKTATTDFIAPRTPAIFTRARIIGGLDAAHLIYIVCRATRVWLGHATWPQKHVMHQEILSDAVHLIYSATTGIRAQWIHVAATIGARTRQ